MPMAQGYQMEAAFPAPTYHFYECAGGQLKTEVKQGLCATFKNQHSVQPWSPTNCIQDVMPYSV